MSNPNFQIRELKESEDPGVHDILYTDAAGVIRYSADVYDSAEEAEKAKAELIASGELPDWWGIYTPTK